jgi:hypothetical protein|tara:strand:- start:675 stop:1235 length:561 start_codon:yes stop_codon:yes gene_type:complete
MFSTAVPGQSLTSEPKNAPWENPPLMVDPEEALLYHLENLKEPKVTESIAGLMALGVDILNLTEGILRTAVATGQHSIDVSLIIAPVIHEYIKGIGDGAGIDYNEGLEDEGQEELDLNSVSLSLHKKQAKEILDEITAGEEVDLSGLENFEGIPDEDSMGMDEQPEMKPQEPQAEKPMGLMSRRTA